MLISHSFNQGLNLLCGHKPLWHRALAQTTDILRQHEHGHGATLRPAMLRPSMHAGVLYHSHCFSYNVCFFNVYIYIYIHVQYVLLIRLQNVCMHADSLALSSQDSPGIVGDGDVGEATGGAGSVAQSTNDAWLVISGHAHFIHWKFIKRSVIYLKFLDHKSGTLWLW